MAAGFLEAFLPACKLNKMGCGKFQPVAGNFPLCLVSHLSFSFQKGKQTKKKKKVPRGQAKVQTSCFMSYKRQHQGSRALQRYNVSNEGSAVLQCIK